MSRSGKNEAFVREEFPKMPKDYKDFHVLPSTITVGGGIFQLKLDDLSTIKLRNSGNYPVLYKIKCTSNNRISILDCAGILLPRHETDILVYRHNCEIDETDRFLILYTIVGMQWCTEDANALLCWQRVKAQQIPTKSIIRIAKLEQSNIS